jgi:hypothetical protein
VLILVHEREDLYLGIIAFSAYLLTNLRMSLTTMTDLIRKKYNFTDPHHAHYFLQNVSKYLLKVWFLLFMLIDMIFGPNQHPRLMMWIYSTIVFFYTIWNMVILHARIKKTVFWFLITRDLSEDFFIIVQWLHYQKEVDIH